MLYRIIIIFGLLLWMVIGAQGQQQLEDVIHLENGEVIRGEVLEYNPKTTIKIKILGGSVLVYKSSEVLKIEKAERAVEEKKPRKKRAKRPPNIKDKGVYHSVMAGFIFSGNRSATRGLAALLDPPIGIGGQYALGYHWNRLIGIGGGLGTLGPYCSTGRQFLLPMYVHARGYLMKTSMSVYYDAEVGYGLLLEGVGQWITLIGHGFYARPAVGFRFGSTRKCHVTVDAGLMIHPCREQFSSAYGFSLRAGIVF